MLLITYSSSYFSTACSGVDEFLLRWSVSAKCLPAIWPTLIKSELAGPVISLALRCTFCSTDCVWLMVRVVGDPWVILSFSRKYIDGNVPAPKPPLISLIHWWHICFPYRKGNDWQIRSVSKFRQVVLARAWPRDPLCSRPWLIMLG